jgi:2-amino-4-hydroxy-6-hydroxymethyldihydropteridine diphosphokinase
MARIYLSLGANLGNRARNLYAALRRLQSQVRLDQISSLYETEPVGPVEQPWYLNMACSGETTLTPEALLDFVKGIEREIGRQKGIRFGPRLIDIDILLYDDLVVDTERLEIPHPRFHKRGFVLVPLEELAPDLVHPVLKSDVRALLERADSPETVIPYRLRDRQATG